MDTPKRVLTSVIFLAFLLSVMGADGSYAKTKKQSPLQDLPRMTVAGSISEIITDDVEFDYLRIRIGDSEQWVAAPKKGFSVGDTVSCDEGVIVKNHRSKQLKQTFDSIIFTECAKE